MGRYTDAIGSLDALLHTKDSFDTYDVDIQDVLSEKMRCLQELAQQHSGRYEDVVDCFKASHSQIADTKTIILLLVGHSLWQMGDHNQNAQYYEEATKYLDNACDRLKKGSEEHEAALVRRGVLLGNRRKYEDANDAFDEVRSLYPDSISALWGKAEILIQLACALSEIGCQSRAAHYWRKAIKYCEDYHKKHPGKKQPDDFDVWFGRGICHFKLHENKLAETCFERAHSIDSKSTKAQSWLGLAKMRS